MVVSSQVPTPPTACARPVQGQLDFWIGQWVGFTQSTFDGKYVRKP